MTQLRLGAAGVNTTPLDWETNRQNIVAAIRAAREAEVGVLCLPELGVSGYGCEDAFFAQGVLQTSLDLMTEIVSETQGLVTTLGVPLQVQDKLYNVVALACNGVLLGFVAKQHLAGDGIHYEPRWFHPWPAGDVREVRVAGKAYPVGDWLLDCGGIKIGLEVCRDAWVKNRPGSRLAARGADIILNPSASHFAFAKQEIRRRFVLDGSQNFHVSYVYSNLLGNESGRAIFDGGTLIASRGEMLAVGPRLTFGDYVLATADVDVAATRRDRAKANLPVAQGITVNYEFSLPIPSSSREATKPAAWDTSPPPKEEEFARAVPLALFDYLRKSCAGGFVVSLSGGADSSAVATMIWLMGRFGCADIGLEAFLKKLSHIPKLRDASNVSLIQNLLTCVYQSTCNSSDVTRDAARTVAEAIGAEFLEWNVDSAVSGYVSTVSQAVGRELSWEEDDLALQNIQARARGP
ncbi:MAG: NAD+ synthetase, partial [Pirellulales bacterium]|nr:NAD+ synthetase [Pirellulales bacterium]